MRFVRVLIALLVCVVAGAIIAAAVERLTGQSTSNGYMVRAVFDNSSFVIPGEEVKVAGVTIGTINTVQLTQQNKAAVVLQITNKHFEPFRTDAHCEIGIASLLGEQFVQCTPTQPHSSGDPIPPALTAIKSGPDQGEHLLPVQNTTTPIGLDLLNDINRLPEQERLRLIISGLGAGLAGNGQELNAALKRADPALQQTDKVIAVLASQDRTLARLTDESSRVLAPLAAQRRHIAGFVQHAGTVATASAAEGQAIEQNIGDLPPFLRQLRPAAARLGNLAGQLTPALASLGSQAPAINDAVTNLGPLAKTSIPAFKTLGDAAQRGETVFPQAHAVSEQLLSLGKPLMPLSTDLASVAQSFDNAGGIEDVMRFIYYYTGAVNGEDSLGHYIRALVEISACVPRSSHPLGGCGSTFGTTTLGSAAAASAPVSTAAMLTPRWTLTWPAAGTNHATLGDTWPTPRSQASSRRPTTPSAATAPSGPTDAARGSSQAAAGQSSSTASTSSTTSTSASSTTAPTAPATSSSTTSSSDSATRPEQGNPAAPASAPGSQPSGPGSLASTKKLLSYLLSP
jgi:ABC-type transporter Mla subunit MlaD